MACCGRCFFAFKVAFPDLPRIWLAFIYAIPAMFIVTLVLSALWHPPIFSYLSVCGIVWGVALSVDISLNVPNVSLIYIIAAVLQVLIALWWLMKTPRCLQKFAFRTKQKAQKPLRTKRKVLPKNKFARFVSKQAHANVYLIPLKQSLKARCRSDHRQRAFAAYL